MNELVLWVDGVEVASDPRPIRDDSGIQIPLEIFSEAIHATLQEIGVDGGIALCRGELCVPIDTGSRRDIGGIDYVSLDLFGEAFGLRWWETDEELRVETKGMRDMEGLDTGQVAPGFTLPDMYTGELVSSETFRGRKTLFFMWASW